MKKIILNITIGLAGVGSFTACCDNAIDGSIAGGMTIEEAMQPGDVEIVLGAGVKNMESRASINSLGTYFQTHKNDTLGVFALATGVLTQNMKDNPYGNINWAGDWVDVLNDKGHKTGRKHVFNDPYSVYLNNTRAGVIYKTVGLGSVTGSQIAWMDTDNGKEYFPLMSWHKYSFYAYNPRVDSISYSANQVVAVMRNLKGCEDVIWGCVEPSEIDPCRDWAYSADYFRQRETINRPSDVATEMTMQFEHKMMRLTFDITAGSEEELKKIDKEPTLCNYDNAYATKVHSICILNAPDEVKLVVADKNPDPDNNHQGELTYSASRNRKYYLKDERVNVHNKTVLDSLLAPVAPKPKYDTYVTGNRDETNVPDTIRVGESIILPALTDEDRMNKPYKMRVLLEYPVGTFQYKDFTLQAPNGKFEAGKSYNLCLKIFSPKDITMSGTSSGWDVVNTQQYNKYVDPIKEETERKIEEERKKKEEEERRKQEEEERNKNNDK